MQTTEDGSGGEQKVRRGAGRRPGKADTRGVVLGAARTEFAAHGYEKATMRGIARAAGVDVALVHHYFTSKDRLFLAALEFPVEPGLVVGQMLAGDRADVGERVARTVLTLWETEPVRERLLALVRAAATHEQIAALIRGFVVWPASGFNRLVRAHDFGGGSGRGRLGRTPTRRLKILRDL